MTELSHEQVRAYLQLDRTSLTPNERVAVDEHLQVCADCRAYADDLSDLQASLTQTMHQRWDAAPVPKFAPRVLSRLQKSKLPQRAFSYTIGLGALVALILLLQAFFTAQLQLTTQSPVATEPNPAGATITPPLVSTAIAVTPFNVRPTPTLLGGRDFYRLQRLTNTATGAFNPAVSPDGQRVAYASERDGNWDIYMLDLNQKVETRLTDDPLADMAPSWSPDGTRIAYQHNVPSADGPVLIDYTVMNADGTNKRVMFSGAHWLKNEAPQWSPAGDRLAFTNGPDLVIVPLDAQSNALTIQAVDQHTYDWPVWLGDQFLIYVDNGQIMSNDLMGNSQEVLTLPDPVQMIATSPPYIVYIQQRGNTIIQVGRTGLDEISARTLAVFAANLIKHVALSPNGQFVAIQTDTGIVVVDAELPSFWQHMPLFRFSSDAPPGDLLSVSWLPDSSGFVYVGMAEGIPELQLVQLNMSALDYFKAFPTPVPMDTSAFGPIVTSFSPDPFVTLDGSAGFSFGASITTTSQIDVIVHIVAFAVRPEEALADCTTRVISTDWPFWANQADFAPGQIVYSQGFTYANEVPEADRLVVRINLTEPGVTGRLLYCTQQVYQLLPSGVPLTRTSMPPTPAPTATPYVAPSSPGPTPDVTSSPPEPTPPPSPTPYVTPSSPEPTLDVTSPPPEPTPPPSPTPYGSLTPTSL